jgi:hypothetical protein
MTKVMPTPAELDTYMAEKVMGWTKEQSYLSPDDSYWVDLTSPDTWQYVAEGHDYDIPHWGPTQSHDQAQMVIEKLSDEDCEYYVTCLSRIQDSHRMIHFAKATPLQKMQAVWLALEGE